MTRSFESVPSVLVVHLLYCSFADGFCVSFKLSLPLTDLVRISLISWDHFSGHCFSWLLTNYHVIILIVTIRSLCLFNTACYLAMFFFVSLHYTSQRTKIMSGLFSLSVVLWVLCKVLICFSHFSFQCSPSVESHWFSIWGFLQIWCQDKFLKE